MSESLGQKYRMWSGDHKLRHEWQRLMGVTSAAWRAWKELPNDDPNKLVAYTVWMECLDRQADAFDAWEESKKPGAR